jgi:hypothetical protein
MADVFTLEDKRLSQIAHVAHEAYRAYCRTLDEFTKMPWQYAPKWQHDITLSCVRYAIATPNSSPQQVHDHWLAVMYEAGWSYGADFNEANHTHQYVLPYDKLPTKRRRKYALMVAIVAAFMAG